MFLLILRSEIVLLNLFAFRSFYFQPASEKEHRIWNYLKMTIHLMLIKALLYHSERVRLFWGCFNNSIDFCTT